MVSNDPDFETKAADVIGLYLNPPAHAVVFCVDETTTIQVLDRNAEAVELLANRDIVKPVSLVALLDTVDSTG